MKMSMKTLEGKLLGKDMKIGIVAARFNEFITAKLVGGAMDGLIRHEVKEDDIQVAWVPGAFEIPLIAENIEQAIERAGTKAGNKGYDCAVSAIEMVNLIREMK